MLQLVTNRGLISEPQYIGIHKNPNIPIMVLPGANRSLHVLRHESPFCNKLKHQNRFFEVLFVLRVWLFVNPTSLFICISFQASCVTLFRNLSWLWIVVAPLWLLPQVYYSRGPFQQTSLIKLNDKCLQIDLYQLLMVKWSIELLEPLIAGKVTATRRMSIAIV